MQRPRLVDRIPKHQAAEAVVRHHYLHRKPPISECFGLLDEEELVGVVTFGTPPSRHLQLSLCPSNPGLTIELNRLWLHDSLPTGTGSWFVSRALAMLPPRIVVSYADTARGHLGYIYRALSFYYAGWTDMERKTARLDYLVDGKHSRDAFRRGDGARARTVRRKPKIKYWTVTGNRRDKKRLEKLCAWPKLSWKDLPPPTEHKQCVLV